MMIMKSYSDYGAQFPVSIRELKNLRWRLMFNKVADNDLNWAAEFVTIYTFLISITDGQRNEIFSKINKVVVDNSTKI